MVCPVRDRWLKSILLSPHDRENLGRPRLPGQPRLDQ